MASIEFIHEELKKLKLDHYFTILPSVKKLRPANFIRIRDQLPVAVLDLLRFHPHFKREVRKIRKELDMAVPLVNKKLSRIIGENMVERMIQTYEFYRYGYDYTESLINVHSENEKIIQKYIGKHHPLLDEKVLELRKLTFKHLKNEYHYAIILYILLDIVKSDCTYFIPPIKKELNIKKVFVEKTKETVINITITPTTDISHLKSSYLNNLQKSLPFFPMPNAKDNEILLRRLFYYVFRKELSLDHSSAVEGLEHIGFKRSLTSSMEPEYASQEIKRFENLFPLAA